MRNQIKSCFDAKSEPKLGCFLWSVPKQAMVDMGKTVLLREMRPEAGLATAMAMYCFERPHQRHRKPLNRFASERYNLHATFYGAQNKNNRFKCLLETAFLYRSQFCVNIPGSRG